MTSNRPELDREAQITAVSESVREFLRRRDASSLQAAIAVSSPEITHLWNTHHSETTARETTANTARFFESLTKAANSTLRQSIQIIAEAFGDLDGITGASIWTYSENHRTLYLAGLFPDQDVFTTSLPVATSLIETAIDENQITHFDLADPQTLARFSTSGLLHRSDQPLVLSVFPIRITGTFISPQLALLLVQDRSKRELSPGLLKDQFVDAAARTLDSSLKRHTHLCTYEIFGMAAAPTSSQHDEGLDGLGKLSAVVANLMNCEDATVFVLDPTSNSLNGVTPDGTLSPNNDHLLKEVWTRKTTLTGNSADTERDSPRVGNGDLAQLEFCLSPIFSPRTENAVGVIRCSNSRMHECDRRSPAFDDLDVEIIGQISQVAGWHVANLDSEKRRHVALRRLLHELGNPLFAIRGTLEEISRNQNVANVMKREFSHDYLSDSIVWAGLMLRILKRASVYEATLSPTLALARSTIHVFRDVIKPAMSRALDFARLRDAKGVSIQCSSACHVLPECFWDGALIQEVVYNLLENAIKYRDVDHASDISVDASVDGDRITLTVAADGIGVVPQEIDMIFSEGVRGTNAAIKDVSGSGIGLWHARTVAEAHGGTITLASCHTPTMFALALPRVSETATQDHATSSRRRP